MNLTHKEIRHAVRTDCCPKCFRKFPCKCPLTRKIRRMELEEELEKLVKAGLIEKVGKGYRSCK